MFKNREDLPEHLRVPWGALDALLFFLAWAVLQVVLAFGLVLLSPRFAFINGFVEALKAQDIGASFALTLIGMVLGFGLVALDLRYRRASWRALGWRRVGLLKTAGYLLAILLIFLVLAQVALTLVQLLVPGFDANQPQTNEFTAGASSHRSLALIALVLLPPIFEETIFRGFIFPALAKRTGLVGGAILSSLVFGLAHGQANLFVYTMLLGLLLCFMYTRLGSIIPGILLHMVNNYLAFLALSGK